MANLSQDQVRQIIQNAPAGTTPAGIVAALRQQGHTLEGYPGQDPTGNHSFIANLARDPFQTLIVNPATRAVQATAGLLGNEKAGATDQMVDLGLLGKYNVPAINSAEQIGGEALKTAGYLMPAGEGGVLNQALTEGVRGTALGAGRAMAQNAPTGEVLKQGLQGGAFGAGTGAAFSLASAGLDKLQPYLEKANLKAPAAKEAKYQGSRVEGGPSRFEEAVQVGTNMPGITPQTKMNSTLSTIQSAEDSLDSVIKSPAMQEVAGYIPTSQVAKEFETAANSPDITSDVRRQLLKEAQTTIERNPDYTPVSFLQDQKKAWGKTGFSEGGAISNEGKAALQDVYKTMVQNALDKVGAQIPVPPEMKAIFPGLPDSMPIAEFNQKYGALLDYKRLLKAAMTKSEIGFVKRLAAEAGGAFLGHSIGGPLGAAAGAVAADQLTQIAPVSVMRTLTGKAGKAIAPQVKKIPKVLVRAY